MYDSTKVIVDSEVRGTTLQKLNVSESESEKWRVTKLKLKSEDDTFLVLEFFLFLDKLKGGSWVITT